MARFYRSARDRDEATRTLPASVGTRWIGLLRVEESGSRRTTRDAVSSVRQRWTDDPAFIPTAVVYGLAFFCGFLGNLFVAVALLVDRRQRAVLAAADGGGGGHQLTTSFLVSLAIADVVYLLVCLPYEMIVKQEAVWQGGLALCKLAGFVEMTTATASVLNLTAVSIERFAFLVLSSTRQRVFSTKPRGWTESNESGLS